MSRIPAQKTKKGGPEQTAKTLPWAGPYQKIASCLSRGWVVYLSGFISLFSWPGFTAYIGREGLPSFADENDDCIQLASKTGGQYITANLSMLIFVILFHYICRSRELERLWGRGGGSAIDKNIDCIQLVSETGSDCFLGGNKMAACIGHGRNVQ
jgi:hypothetical protein